MTPQTREEALAQFSADRDAQLEPRGLITDRDMREYIERALYDRPGNTPAGRQWRSARVEAIFDELHTTYGLIDLDTLTPQAFWANVERVDARLALIVRTRSMSELLDDLVRSWGTAVEGVDPADVVTEIERRLNEIKKYRGTEASLIHTMLDTGK